MYINYVSLLIINMAAALVILAAFLVKGMEEQDRRRWAPAFLVSGLVATFFGGFITVTWPLKGSFNSAFGEPSVMLGMLFVGAAIALFCGLDMLPLGIYAFFAGIAAVIIGIRIIMLRFTWAPEFSGFAFIITGLAGLCSLIGLRWQSQRTIRLMGAAVLLIAALCWVVLGCYAYWVHMDSFKSWLPAAP